MARLIAGAPPADPVMEQWDDGAFEMTHHSKAHKQHCRVTHVEAWLRDQFGVGDNGAVDTSCFSDKAKSAANPLLSGVDFGDVESFHECQPVDCMWRSYLA